MRNYVSIKYAEVYSNDLYNRVMLALLACKLSITAAKLQCRRNKY